MSIVINNLKEKIKELFHFSIFRRKKISKQNKISLSTYSKTRRFINKSEYKKLSKAIFNGRRINVQKYY